MSRRAVQLGLLGGAPLAPRMEQRTLFAVGESHRPEALPPLHREAQAWARRTGAAVLGYETLPGLVGPVDVVRVRVGACERLLTLDDIRAAL